MVNAPKKMYSPLPVGRYGDWTKSSAQRRHHANEGMSGLEAERLRALGALGSLRSKKKRGAEKRQEMHFLSNEEIEKWIEDYVERETSGARKGVEDAQAVVQQDQDDMTHAEIARSMPMKPEETFEEILVTIGDSPSDLASSDYAQDGEDLDENQTEQGKLSEDDEPSWVMGTIPKTVQQGMEMFRQKQMNLDKVSQPGWQDADDNFREQDKKYGSFKLTVPAVIQPHTNDDTPATPQSTFEGLVESLDIVSGLSQRPQGTSRQGSSHIRLGSVKPRAKSSIPRGEPAVEPNSSMLLQAKPVEPVISVEPLIICPCI